MRILMYPWPEPGHILPTFAFARALQDRGHEVVYACTLDFRDTIVTHGFRYEVVRRELFPLGRMRALQQMSGDRRAQTMPLIWSRIVFDALAGHTEHELRAIAPTLVIADVIDFVLPFVLHDLGIPFVRMSTSLSQTLDELPPITTALSPLDPKPALAAAQATARSALSERKHLRLALTELCTRFAYPFDAIELGALVPFLPEYPEVVLCPRAFDFPRERGGPTYFATVPDLDREEHVADSLRTFCDGSTLVYVSLGTQTARYRHASRLLNAAIEVARSRPELRMVIATDESSVDALAAGAPPNVFVTHDAPQLWLLRRAAVFVTHSGLGSVREAIAHHVPMLALPHEFDQPGNCARIVWHQIGLTTDPATIVASKLEHHIEALLRDGSKFRERLARLDAAMRGNLADTSAIELVESTLATRPPLEVPELPEARSDAVTTNVDAEALFEYVDWCTEIALEEDRDRGADLLTKLRAYRARISADAPETELRAIVEALRVAHPEDWRSLTVDTVVTVYGLKAHEAALMARDMMVRMLAARSVDRAATAPERARIYKEHFQQALERANAELVRRLVLRLDATNRE